MTKFTMSLLVSEAAIDELGHVNNVVYVQWIELVSRAHPESVGLDTDGFLEHGGIFVVRRHEIDYFAPAHVGEEITLTTWIGEHRGSRAERFVEISRGDKQLVSCRTEWIWVDPLTRRPKRVPVAMLELLG